jgi:hypothetical protein
MVCKAMGRRAPTGRDFEKSSFGLGFSPKLTGTWVGDSSGTLELEDDVVNVLESGCCLCAGWRLNMCIDGLGRGLCDVNGLSRAIGGMNWSRESRGLFFGGVGVEYSFDSEDSSYTACLFPHEALFSCRCCRVDLRRDDDRFGMLENEPDPVTDCADRSYSGTFVSSWISNFGDDVGP